MTSLPFRQPPQNQGVSAVTHTDSTENRARSGVISVQAVFAANRANANDAAQDISAPPAESGGGNDGHVIVSTVQDSHGHDGVDFPSIY